MSLPHWRDWLYSVKAFTAGMLAFYIALALSLPQPYWCLTTVYIVSHPLAGTTRSKAVYRIFGTLLGATAAVVMVPNLVDNRVLLCLAIASWIGVLLYLALLNRTPSGYIFMLSAYTMPLIGLPAVNHPELVYEIALARSEEILLGIVCASLVSTLIFPRRLGPVVAGHMGKLLNDASCWTLALFNPARGPGDMSDTRHQLLSELAAMDAMIRQMAYDSDNPKQLEHAQQIRLRMTMLIPQATALFDPLDALQQRHSLAAESVEHVLQATLQWIRQTPNGSSDRAKDLQKMTTHTLHAFNSDEVDHVLVRNAMLRLSELIDLWQDCRALHKAYIYGSEDAPRLTYRNGQLDQNVRYFDHGLMMFSAVSAAAATFVASLLWILLGWDAGVGGVILIAIASCFFASSDDPTPQLNAFLSLNIVGAAFALIYVFAILPQVQTYLGLLLVLAPPLCLIGIFTGQPKYNSIVVLFVAFGVTDLGLSNAYSANFTTFANSSLAAIFGAIFALVWASVTKPFGTELVARRLARSTWRDLAQLAGSREPGDQARLTSHMVDRFSQLLPRIALLQKRQLAQLDATRDVRVCLRLLDLETRYRRLPSDAGSGLDDVLLGVRDYYLNCAAAGRPLAPPDALRSQLDGLVRALVEHPDTVANEAAQALAGLRLALFRVASPAPSTADARANYINTHPPSGGDDHSAPAPLPS